MVGLSHTLPVVCSRKPLNSKYNRFLAGLRDTELHRISTQPSQIS